MIDASTTCDGFNDNVKTGDSFDLPEGVPALRIFYLYLSAGCNLHCKHCWITPTFVNGKPSPGECIDLNLLKLAVNEAKPLGLNAAKLTGGEPMLHPDFIDIVDYLTAENLNITMETNGTLIDSNIASHLKKKSNLTHIAISLDSPTPEQHDEFRGVSGAFRAASNGIRLLAEEGFRPQVIMSVYRDNLDQVEGLVRLALDLGAGSVKFNPVNASGRGVSIHSKGLGLSFQDIINLSHYIRGPLREKYPAINLNSMIPAALLSVKELLQTSGVGGGICSVRNILGILGSGDMALCGIGKNVPELCFGKLGKDRIRDIWLHHPTLVKLRKDLSGDLPGLCGDCLHAGRCQAHCVAMNYEQCGKLVMVCKLCEEAEKQGLFPDTRRISWNSEK